MNDDKLSLCDGCRNDFYNDRQSSKRCWSYAKANPVKRWRLDWWIEPTRPGAFVEVETLPCHHAPGKYAHSETLPEFAISPRRLLRKIGIR